MAEFTIEREAPDAFRWHLKEGPAREIARSGRIFPSFEEARSAIEEMKRAAAQAELVTPPPSEDDRAVDERSEQSFPASDPPSTWASAGGTS